jgi:1-deoxy-D-xylulose-5-phosphate synthase
VTFVLDRAGVTGEDGPSHNGMWDMSVLQLVPGLRLAAPRDATTLRLQLREAVNVADGPTVVRFPKATVGDDITAIDTVGGMDVLYRAGDDDVLLISVGALASTCLDLAARISDQGIGVTVVDPRWVKPVDPALPALAARHRLVVTVEDNGRVGGVGTAIAGALRDAGVPTPVRVFGLPQQFLEHASRAQVLTDVGLDAQALAREVVSAVARIDHALEIRSES